MPFEDETKDLNLSQNSGLKNVSTKPSIFDKIPKKPSATDFKNRVHAAEEQRSENQIEGKELAQTFMKMLVDKTLRENKSPFVLEREKEVLGKMVEFSMKINADEMEPEGAGSMAWITLLLNICLGQRDRMNRLEFELVQMKKNLQPLDGNEKKD